MESHTSPTVSLCWLVTLILGLVLRPFLTKLTGKVDAGDMKVAIERKTSIAFAVTDLPALILFVLAFSQHLPGTLVALGMVANAVHVPPSSSDRSSFGAIHRRVVWRPLRPGESRD